MQNAFLKHEDLVLKIKISRKMKTKYMTIMEVDPLTHTRILNEGKLSIGWSTCRVFDYIRVFRCFRCWGFDHRASECSKDSKCLKCGVGDHTKENCESSAWKCVNCSEANITLKLHLDVDYSPFSEDCQSLKRKLDLQRRKINTESISQ